MVRKKSIAFLLVSSRCFLSLSLSHTFLSHTLSPPLLRLGVIYLASLVSRVVWFPPKLLTEINVKPDQKNGCFKYIFLLTYNQIVMVAIKTNHSKIKLVNVYQNGLSTDSQAFSLGQKCLLWSDT